MDVLRGFSGAEKLAYSSNVWEFILNSETFSLEMFVGCPVEIFSHVGNVLSAAKEHMNKTICRHDFQDVLDESERILRRWDVDASSYPTPNPQWKLLAEAYRQAGLLRVLRFPNPMEVPCEDPRIQDAVITILDISAQIPAESPFYKRLLFPLFLAGADTSSPHQKHYVRLCIDAIKSSTGFQHQAMMGLLDKVWTERIEMTQGWNNVPWMEYV